MLPLTDAPSQRNGAQAALNTRCVDAACAAPSTPRPDFPPAACCIALIPYLCAHTHMTCTCTHAHARGQTLPPPPLPRSRFPPQGVLVKCMTGETVEVRRALQVGPLRERLAGVLAAGICSVAVVLKHAAIFPDHERAVGQLASQPCRYRRG